MLAALDAARADLDQQRRGRDEPGDQADGRAGSEAAAAAGGDAAMEVAEDERVASPVEQAVPVPMSQPVRSFPRLRGVTVEDCGQLGSAEPPCAQEVAGPGRSVSLADGLLHLSRCYLDRRGRARPGAARRSRSRLQLLVDPLSGWARLPDGELLPPRCSTRLLRDLSGWGLRRPPLPCRPAGDLDPQRRVDAGTLPPQVTDRYLDLDHAVWVLMQQAA